MTLSHFKVIGVVCRGDLHTPSSKILVYVWIPDDRYLSVCQRKLQGFADKVCVSLVLRIHSNRCVPQHCFWSGSCNLNKLTAPCDGISDMPKVARLLRMFYLCIRDRCLAYGAPVYDSGAFVNISFVIEFYKHFFHCLGAALIHGKPLSVPVSGCPKLFQLIDNSSAVLILPCPGMFQKRVSSYIVFINSLFFQLLNDLYFGGYGRVVRARLP